MLRLSGDIRSPGPNQIPSHEINLHSCECYACSILNTSCDFVWAVPLTQGGHPTWHPTFAAPPLLLGVPWNHVSGWAGRNTAERLLVWFALSDESAPGRFRRDLD
jgi:hypothetical protein